MNKSSQVQERLDFIGLDTRAVEKLRGLRGFVAQAIGPALDVFYGKIKKTPQVQRFFKNDSHMAGAQSRQADHWRIIAEGQFGEDYAKGVRTIGETHARLGLEPQWYIGGYALVLEGLIKAIVKADAGKRSLFGRKDKGDALGAALALGAKRGGLLIAVVVRLGIQVDASIQLTFLVRHNSRHRSVSGYIDHSAHHIEEPVHANNQCHTLHRQTGLLQNKGKGD